MKEQPETVVLIGASVRAAAFSALRAGLVPWCLDLFADADLRAAAETRRCPIEVYPQCFLDRLRGAPSGPVIYTGGLENDPDLIAKIAETRTIWGNGAESLRLSRDPFFVKQLLSENGLQSPRVSRSQLSGPSLRKPLKSAGGANISFAESAHPDSGSFYFQEFIGGSSCSAVFCAYSDQSTLLGVTQQLTGEPWLHAKRFHYCGSIGPIALMPAVIDALKRIGEVLRIGCGLRGLFGIDFILNDENPWLVEVNPRYTASIEVLEYATGLRSLDLHRRAFEGNSPHSLLCSRDAEALRSGARQARAAIDNSSFVGKAILFAPTRLLFPVDLLATTTVEPSTRPNFADIPQPGEVIEEGWPILTVLAEASTLEMCRFELQSRARAVYERFPGMVQSRVTEFWPRSATP